MVFKDVEMSINEPFSILVHGGEKDISNVCGFRMLTVEYVVLCNIHKSQRMFCNFLNTRANCK